MKAIFSGFESLKKNKKKYGLASNKTLASISDIFQSSQRFFKNCEHIQLNSKVPGKAYFAFSDDKKISRAINKPLYERGIKDAKHFLQAVEGETLQELNPATITAACYVVAISYCAAVDLLKSGDQKTPGTFFEYLMGHLFARALNLEPEKSLPVLNLDMKTSLPTDFIFDLGLNKAKIHLPVKTSTRERVIQVWAHQRLLDGVYGVGRFLGTLACLAETKLDKKKLEVVEICLPDQWCLYQMYIAQLSRIYYLDMPEAYRSLSDKFPKILVKELGHFFHEIDALTG